MWSTFLHTHIIIIITNLNEAGSLSLEIHTIVNFYFVTAHLISGIDLRDPFEG